jgi:N-acetyl-beta-hexosaminidase
MAASKLNTLHWHIMDGVSFPLHLDSIPELAAKVLFGAVAMNCVCYHALRLRLGMRAQGAWSVDKVYSKRDVAELIQYAAERGIR